MLGVTPGPPIPIPTFMFPPPPGPAAIGFIPGIPRFIADGFMLIIAAGLTPPTGVAPMAWVEYAGMRGLNENCCCGLAIVFRVFAFYKMDGIVRVCLYIVIYNRKKNALLTRV